MVEKCLNFKVHLMLMVCELFAPKVDYDAGFAITKVQQESQLFL